MQHNYEGYNTFWLVTELVLKMKPQMLEVAEAHNLTPQQLHVLSMLRGEDPRPMSWLAALLFCDASNVTGLVDRMVALKLIERIENEKDRRVKMIRLTPLGVKTHEAIMNGLSVESQELIDSVLSSEEQVTFRRIIVKLLMSNKV